MLFSLCEYLIKTTPHEGSTLFNGMRDVGFRAAKLTAVQATPTFRCADAGVIADNEKLIYQLRLSAASATFELHALRRSGVINKASNSFIGRSARGPAIMSADR
ncbi:hypothetical protein CUJ88_25185 [Paraburkholderia hospita]|nr:hypothetical protein CUJ88_25185 [Paraburkholderia hospita]